MLEFNRGPISNAELQHHLCAMNDSQPQQCVYGFYRSTREERFNACIHALGAVGSLLAIGWLLAAESLPNAETWPFYCYAATLVGMYLASTLSHAVMEPAHKHLWRVVDQAVIYLLIAGTYTPVLAMHLEGPLRVASLAVLWAVALWGFARKAGWEHDVVEFSARSYLALGWLPALCLMPWLPKPVLIGLLAGGVVYSVGAWFLLNDRRAWYFHGVWHAMVIAASGCHFYTIYRYVLLV